MLIAFSISLIGHTLVHRTFSVIAREFAFSHRWIRRFNLANLVVISFLTACAASTPTLLWLFIGILLITLKFFPEILRFFLRKRLRSALIPLLDSVILGLQSGKSFRASLHSAVEMQGDWERLQLQEVVESLQFSEQPVAAKSALIKDFQAELREIDRSQSRCVEQVRALRRDYRMQEDFRRRSGQVSQQIKMQAIIVTALYFALLVFVIMQFGFERHQNMILISSVMFSGGLFFIFYTGRRMKWRV